MPRWSWRLEMVRYIMATGCVVTSMDGPRAGVSLRFSVLYFCARHSYGAKYSVKDSRKDPLILVAVMTKGVSQNTA